MQLYLIRHGESIGNTKKGFISGRSDLEGLSKKGKTQIIRTAWELKDEKFDRIISSPVARAHETASIINTFVDTKFETQEWLSELNHGLFEGHHWWEVMDQVPASWRKTREDFDSPYPGGGESLKTLVERVWDGYQKFLETYKEEEKVIMVSHQAVIAAIIYCIQFGNPSQLDSPQKQKEFLTFIHSTLFSNGAITRIELQDKKLVDFSMQNLFEQAQGDDETIAFYLKGLIKPQSSFSVEPIRTSSGNSVFKLRNNEQCFILKIYHQHETLTIERLVKLYRYLDEQTRIDAPKIIHYERNNVFFKSPVLVQDYIEGHEQGVCLKECNAEKILDQTFSLVQKIHLIPSTEVESFWLTTDWKNEPHPTFAEYFKKEIKWTIEKMHASQLLSEDLCTKLKTKLQDLYFYIKKEEYCVVPLHGDLTPHNIVMQHVDDECKLIRALDFERARLGDRVWDYVYYLGWINRIDEELADYWRKITFQKLNEEEKKVFDLYEVLFHAWTIRDMFEYEGDETRKKRALKSKEILETILGNFQ